MTIPPAPINSSAQAILDLKYELDEQAIPLVGRKIRLSPDCASAVFSIFSDPEIVSSIFSNPEVFVGSRIFGFEVAEVSGRETVVYLGDGMDPPIEPFYPEPEDAPEEHADYLRRRVVAMARRYFVEHGREDLKAKESYAGLCLVGAGSGSERNHATLEDIAQIIKNLDAWKKEFNLKDID